MSTTRVEVRLAIEAMATRFELVLQGSDEPRLRAAGEEALEEIARLERQLSFYQTTSEITWINAHAARQPVRVEAGLFRLLQRCQTLSVATGGAFDVTIGPLMRAWRFVGGAGEIPDHAALARAHASTGFTSVHLDPDAFTVSFACPGMSIDLGAAGKGFAVDRAIETLRAQGVQRALLHGGTSSVHAIGAPEGETRWPIAWQQPDGAQQTFALRDTALSVSAIHGKSFVVDGCEYGHVIDPRTGRPTRAARSAAVTGPRSFECDALSTALLVLGPTWVPTLRQLFPEYDGVAA